MKLAHWFRFAFLTVLSAVIVAACQNTTSDTPNSELPTLKFGYNPWPGYFPVAIAQEKGFFAEQGVTVETVYAQDIPPQVADFAAEKLDGMVMNVADFIVVSGKNPGVRLVATIDESDGADAVVARSGIKGAADLKGKRIGATLGTFGELFTLKFLEANQLTPDDVVLVEMDASQVPKQLQNGTIEAGYVWEPFVSQSVSLGAQVLFTSKDAPGLITDGIAFHDRILRDRPEEVRAFLRAWFQALDYWQTHPEEGTALIAKTLNIDPKTISLNGVKMLNASDNLKAFTPGNTTASLHYTARLYNDFFIRTGSMRTPAKIEQLLDASFLPSSK